MISEKPNGGAAFGEFKQCGDRSVKSGGLTVRDYFAAKAAAGMVSGAKTWPMDSDLKHVARISYELADAMLQERAK